jgi:hypothetical protein
MRSGVHIAVHSLKVLEGGILLCNIFYLCSKSFQCTPENELRSTNLARSPNDEWIDALEQYERRGTAVLQ